jgi:hypothetical protein
VLGLGHIRHAAGRSRQKRDLARPLPFPKMPYAPPAYTSFSDSYSADRLHDTVAKGTDTIFVPIDLVSENL